MRKLRCVLPLAAVFALAAACGSGSVGVPPPVGGATAAALPSCTVGPTASTFGTPSGLSLRQTGPNTSLVVATLYAWCAVPPTSFMMTVELQSQTGRSLWELKAQNTTSAVPGTDATHPLALSVNTGCEPNTYRMLYQYSMDDNLMPLQFVAPKSYEVADCRTGT
jgi:hypothetical protein